MFNREEEGSRFNKFYLSKVKILEIVDKKKPRETGEKLAHRNDRTSGGTLTRWSSALEGFC